MADEMGNSRSVGRIVCIGTGMIALLVGCASIEEFAPPISQEMLASAPNASDYNIGNLAQGRAIYLDQCITCHAARPIDEYSLKEWDVILTRMNPKSNLSANEVKVLREYVIVAHGILSNPPAPASN